MSLRFLRQIFICFALVFGLAAQADEVAIPRLEHRVTDLTSSLRPDELASLEAKLTQFEQQKGSQIAILIVPSTKPEEIEQYSIRVVEAWKIGRKKTDDGVLVLIAKDDHKIRIEVGYGLEGAIPDVYAKRIIAEIIAPHFKQGDFYGGLNAGVDKLIGLVSGEQLPAPAQTRQSSVNQLEHLLPLLLFGGLFVGGLLRAIFGRFLGGVATGGLIGAVAWVLGGSLVMAIVLAIIAFFITLAGGANMLNAMGGYGGGNSGGFGSGGGFSGGGGGFGGGGASGDW